MDELLQKLKRLVYNEPGCDWSPINGAWPIHRKTPRSDGYVQLNFRVPWLSKPTSTSVSRAAMMIHMKTFHIDPMLDVSHLCFNKNCVRLDHL